MWVKYKNDNDVICFGKFDNINFGEEGWQAFVITGQDSRGEFQVLYQAKDADEFNAIMARVEYLMTSTHKFLKLMGDGKY